MTVFLAIMAVVWLVTLIAYWILLARYKAVIAPRRRLPITYSAGTWPEPPFTLLMGEDEMVVTKLDPDGQWFEVRDRQWADGIRYQASRLRQRTRHVRSKP